MTAGTDYCFGCHQDRPVIHFHTDRHPTLCEECWDRLGEPKQMTVGALRKALEGMPDDLPVVARHDGCDTPKPVWDAGPLVLPWTHWRDDGPDRRFFTLLWSSDFCQSQIELFSTPEAAGITTENAVREENAEAFEEVFGGSQERDT